MHEQAKELVHAVISCSLMLHSQPMFLHPVLSVTIVGVEHPIRAKNPLQDALRLNDLDDMKPLGTSTAIISS